MMLPDSYHPQSRGTKTMVYSNGFANQIKDVVCKTPRCDTVPKKITQNLTAITAAIFPNSTPQFPGLSPYKKTPRKTRILSQSSQSPWSSSSSQSLDAFGSQEWFKKSTPDIPIHCSTVQVHWVGRVDFQKLTIFWGGNICWKPGKSMVKCLGTPLFHPSSAMRFWVLGWRLPSHETPAVRSYLSWWATELPSKMGQKPSFIASPSSTHASHLVLGLTLQDPENVVWEGKAKLARKGLATS